LVIFFRTNPKTVTLTIYEMPSPAAPVLATPTPANPVVLSWTEDSFAYGTLTYAVFRSSDPPTAVDRAVGRLATGLTLTTYTEQRRRWPVFRSGVGHDRRLVKTGRTSRRHDRTRPRPGLCLPDPRDPDFGRADGGLRGGDPARGPGMRTGPPATCTPLLLMPLPSALGEAVSGSAVPCPVPDYGGCGGWLVPTDTRRSPLELETMRA
jgi:hypothetical protein